MVGVSPRFLDRFRLAAAPRKAEILSCDAGSFRRTAVLRVPRSIVVSEEAYARAPESYDQLSDELCARLVKVSDQEIADPEIESLVESTVRWA